MLGAAGAMTASAGARPAPRGFVATGTAQAVRVTYTVPDFLLAETIVDAGGPVGQAVVESSGSSRAFGSLPYPGDTVIAAPGLPTAAGQPALPVAYPLYASAEHPVAPSSKVEDPSRQYLLEASAEADKAVGRARAVVGSEGVSTTGTSAAAAVQRGEDGVVTARAETVTEGVSFGGVLKLASVRSASVSTLAAGDAEPASKAELVVDGATVNGLGVTIGPEGVTAVGSGVPVPTDEMTGQVNRALAEAGIAVRVVQGEKVAGGRSADALEVVTKQKLPVPGEPEGTVVYRFGGATAWVAAGQAVPAVEPEPVPGPAPAPPGSGGGGDASVLAAEPLPGAAGDTALPVLGAPSAAPAPPSPVPDRRLVLARDLRPTVRLFYLVLAVAGAALLASSSIWRTKGVQATWTF